MKPLQAEVTIDRIGQQGDGVAALDIGTVYVPATAPGDRVRVALTNRGGGRLQGRMLEVLSPGPARIKPPCPHFTLCGGCTLQHLEDPVYANWKRDLLLHVLSRNGLTANTIEDLHRSPPGSRRRATFAVIRRKTDTVVGFHAHHSHQVIDLTVCPVLASPIANLIPAIRRWAGTALKADEAAEVFVAQTDSGLDLLVRTTACLSSDGRNSLVGLLSEHDLARVSWAPSRRDEAEILAEARQVRAVCGDIPVDLAPGAFGQATPDGEAALVGFVRQETGGAKKAADLFCGFGAFALPLARNGCEVFAVDIDRTAVANLGAAARQAGVPNLGVEQRNLMRKPIPADRLAGNDVVILDPPRVGAKAQMAEIATSKTPCVIAISCNPGTFARDAQILIHQGYVLSRILPVDQFIWSPHLEIAARFDFAG
ncbi:MAG: 23S rRNA (uracil(1939)-C(5))-methyltransferase RlmD [Rhodospirillaceae bacterium]|nr:23S rRNA (uracil(1939)-C(5))-methyltransferase RlmD [Rhodospirillaceae bacterium]MCY4310994.1 23S rRNA (uracil(1939)-C(5))-methyltransferase RlmD [Rhodospirillaceae bacterium]